MCQGSWLAGIEVVGAVTSHLDSETFAKKVLRTHGEFGNNSGTVE